MKTVIIAAAALGGLMSMGLGVANADTIQVEGSYSTLEACNVDGPHVQVTENNGAYSQWFCQQGDDGLYYVFLSS
jgi:hypothetical protein